MRPILKTSYLVNRASSRNFGEVTSFSEPFAERGVKKAESFIEGATSEKCQHLSKIKVLNVHLFPIPVNCCTPLSEVGGVKVAAYDRNSSKLLATLCTFTKAQKFNRPHPPIQRRTHSRSIIG